MAKTVPVPLNKPVRIVLLFCFAMGLCLGIGFFGGVMFEKYLGLSHDKVYSSATSSYTTGQYENILETGKRIGEDQAQLEDRVYRVKINGKSWFESRVQEKMNEAYQDGFESGKRSVMNGPFYNKTREITFTGELKRSDVSFEFVETINGSRFDSYTDEQQSDLTGYSYPGESRIEIKTAQSASDADSTCNHEMLHLMFPDFTHPEGNMKFDDPIYTLTDEVDLGICNSVVKEAVALSG